MWKRRTVELAAMLLVGDGVMAALEPRRHIRLWKAGPPPWRRMMSLFVRRPQLTRLLGGAEVLAGLALASRQRALPS
jgi:hypothetical protein